VYEDKIPINYQAVVMAEELNMSIVTAALNGGEDYELLFTASIEDYEKILAIDNVGIVGHITKPELGLNLVGREGEEIGLKAQGWNSLK
jgi:thiamine-monophosphate kinase